FTLKTTLPQNYGKPQGTKSIDNFPHQFYPQHNECTVLCFLFTPDLKVYLQVEGPERVMEGDKVILTCKPSFTLPSPTIFTWYRNGTALSSSTEQLYLQLVSREDAGRYSCAVLDQNLYSPEITLNVRSDGPWKASPQFP
uniref:Ig-like domain-containing protein n=1 Tax=Astyanax mexicanus TaxID=7994 RepID=A0A3B1K2F4_ASTMX